MKVKLSITIILICASVGLLVITSSTSSATLHLKLVDYKAKFKANPTSLTKGEITVYGIVKEGSIKRFNGVQAEFVIVNKEKNAEEKVFFSGKTLLPDTFKDGSEASVTGRFDKMKNIFVADKVLAKCSSKYDVNSEYKKKNSKKTY